MPDRRLLQVNRKIENFNKFNVIYLIIRLAFRLVKKLFKDSAPAVFVTDDSEAEQEALRKVFPLSKRLLCVFHILQALWRWLTDRDHHISQEHWQPLMDCNFVN